MGRIIASPLLLVVHGRAGGVIPTEVHDLAGELEAARKAPVLLEALTADRPPVRPAAGAEDPLVLVPLFLLPGSHVRRDVPAIAERCRGGRELRRLPFLGAWSEWQRALAEELAGLAAPGAVEPAGAPSAGPRLLHHPLEGRLGAAYLAHLERVTGARCLPTPYSATDREAPPLALSGPALPLALAANRLTDALPPPLNRPLLQRPRFRAVLLERLRALP
jgi:sirohydrochlorin ferrochelatase